MTGREIGVSGLTEDFSGACREGVSKGVRVVCAKNAHQSVARRDLACLNLAQLGALRSRFIRYR